MSDLVNIKVRLHLPEARVGEVIAVSPERADRLVNAKYAVFTDEKATKEIADPAPASSASGALTTPITELPPQSALKAEWEAVAQSLGISLEDDEGNALTKADLIEAVEAAVGSST
jgi:hypothetical protein